MILFDIDRREYVKVDWHWEIISMKKTKVYFDVNNRDYKYSKECYHTNVVWLTETQIVGLLNERCRVRSLK